MGRAERRAEYQQKIDDADRQLAAIGERLTYAWAAIWVGAGIVFVGFAANQLMAATLGAILCVGGWVWKTGLNAENMRLSRGRQAHVDAAKSPGDPE